MFMGGKTNKPEEIVRDMKKHSSTELKTAIKNHPQESRKEWIIWMMERAGKKNGNNINWQIWQTHNKPLEITSQKMIDEKLAYIHHNPL